MALYTVRQYVVSSMCRLHWGLLSANRKSKSNNVVISVRVELLEFNQVGLHVISSRQGWMLVTQFLIISH
jgi:hypothetical protein